LLVGLGVGGLGADLAGVPLIDGRGRLVSESTVIQVFREGASCRAGIVIGMRNKGTSIEKRSLLGPYRRPMSRVLGGSQGVGLFCMSEVSL
jgi:hypothetical protein